MEKQVNWRVLSELGSHRPDGGGGKAIRRAGKRRGFVSSRYSSGALFAPPLRKERRGELMEARRLSI